MVRNRDPRAAPIGSPTQRAAEADVYEVSMRGRSLKSGLLIAALTLGLIGGALPASASRIYDNAEQTSAIGNEGCTVGYWKQEQHFDSWVGYAPSDPIVFILPAYLSSLSGDTFLDALNYPNVVVNTLLGKAELLIKQATAAFLNAGNPAVGYPERRFSDPGNIYATTNAALASGDATTILALAAHYDALNNLGCPLN
jgi:hypothetical protein